MAAIPSGDTPVSKRTVCVVFPRRVVTRAEKPCSAINPGAVQPWVNCGAATVGVAGMLFGWGSGGVPEQRVVGVVHQGGDDDFVDRLQLDGVDRGAGRRSWRADCDLSRIGLFGAHRLTAFVSAQA